MAGLVLAPNDLLKIRISAQKFMRRAEQGELFWGKMAATVKGAAVPYAKSTDAASGVVHINTDVKMPKSGARVTLPIFGRVKGPGMGDRRKLREVDSTFSHDTLDVYVYQAGNRIESPNQIEQLETMYGWAEIANPAMADWYAVDTDEKMTALMNGLPPLNNGYGMQFENFLPGATQVQRNSIVPYQNGNGAGLVGRTYKMGNFTQADYSDINETCTLNFNQLQDLSVIASNERNRIKEPLAKLTFGGGSNVAPSGWLLVTSQEGANQLRRDPMFREANENVDPAWKNNPLLGTHIGSIGNIHVITTTRVMSPANNVQRALLVGAGALHVALPKTPDFMVEDADVGGMIKAIAVHGIWGGQVAAFPVSEDSVTTLIHKNSIAVDFWVA